MSEKDERIRQSLAGGVLLTLCTLLLPILAWPILIFDKLFPDECPPEALICLSVKAIVATLVTEFILYTFLTYHALRLGLLTIKRTSYIGDV
jgi:hypothetical protein